MVRLPDSRCITISEIPYPVISTFRQVEAPYPFIIHKDKGRTYFKICLGWRVSTYNLRLHVYPAGTCNRKLNTVFTRCEVSIDRFPFGWVASVTEIPPVCGSGSLSVKWCIMRSYSPCGTTRRYRIEICYRWYWQYDNRMTDITRTFAVRYCKHNIISTCTGICMRRILFGRRTSVSEIPDVFPVSAHWCSLIGESHIITWSLEGLGWRCCGKLNLRHRHYNYVYCSTVWTAIQWCCNDLNSSGYRVSGTIHEHVSWSIYSGDNRCTVTIIPLINIGTRICRECQLITVTYSVIICSQICNYCRVYGHHRCLCIIASCIWLNCQADSPVNNSSGSCICEYMNRICIRSIYRCTISKVPRPACHADHVFWKFDSSRSTCHWDNMGECCIRSINHYPDSSFTGTHIIINNPVIKCICFCNQGPEGRCFNKVIVKRTYISWPVMRWPRARSAGYDGCYHNRIIPACRYRILCECYNRKRIYGKHSCIGICCFAECFQSQPVLIIMISEWYIYER